MSGVETLYLVFLFVCLLLSVFFSSSETAFISLQRIRLEHMVNTKVKGAERVLRLIQRPEKLLSTILLGNNLVNTAAAALGTALAISLWGEEYGILIATVLVTILILVFGETTPKTLATQHTERLSLALARPIEIVSWLFTPFVVVLSWIASGFSKLVGGTPVSRSLVSSTVPSLCPTDIMVRISSSLTRDLDTGVPPASLLNPEAIQLSATTKGVSNHESTSIGRAKARDNLSAC